MKIVGQISVILNNVVTSAAAVMASDAVIDEYKGRDRVRPKPAGGRTLLKQVSDCKRRSLSNYGPF